MGWFMKMLDPFGMLDHPEDTNGGGSTITYYREQTLEERAAWHMKRSEFIRSQEELFEKWNADVPDSILVNSKYRIIHRRCKLVDKNNDDYNKEFIVQERFFLGGWQNGIHCRTLDQAKGLAKLRILNARPRRETILFP